MKIARVIGDFRSLEINGKPATVAHLQANFDRCKRFLEQTLIENKDRNCVVMAHHLPSYRSISDRFKLCGVNACFYSNLDSLVSLCKGLKAWVHGHTHDDLDYLIDHTRVLCNPRGYAGMEGSAVGFGFKTFEI